VPQWCERFPELAPYLLLLWTEEQTQANSVAEQRCRESLAALEDDFSALVDPKSYFEKALVQFWSWNGNKVWVALSNRVVQIGPAGTEARQVSLSSERNEQPRCLAQSADRLWIGTQGAGLLALDKNSGALRRWTDQDGLLMNHIQALLLEGSRLWIGYGKDREDNGGLGQLDLETATVRNFVAPLPLRVGVSAAGPSSSLDAPREPPRSRVVGIARGDQDTLWLAAWRKGFQAFHPASNTWTTYRASDAAASVFCLAADPLRVIVGCATDDPSSRGTKRGLAGPASWRF